MNNIVKKSVFYVYIYLDPSKKGLYKYEEYTYEYEPFYVGKGKGSRYIAHLAEAKNTNSKSYNSYKSKKIRKIFSFGITPIIIFQKKEMTETDAESLEKELIKKIGRFCENNNGPLCNITSGGDGIRMVVGNRKGCHLSSESKSRISASKKGMKSKPHSKETREKISLSRRGIVFSDKHKIKLSFARSNRLISQETRDKTKKTSTGKINIKKYRLYDPYGKVHITTNGLQDFCRKHNLSHSNLFKVMKGERKNHKGWILESMLLD